MSHSENSGEPLNFIEEIIVEDLKSGKHDSIQVRFPPEPNGFLHIGHAKAICLSFGLAQKYNGKCNLRFDDTNPEAEDQQFVDGIREDVQWLGFNWDGEYFASDYFQQLYDWAVELVKAGKAYVDDSTKEELAVQRGTPTRPGTPSPRRDRPVEENLDLLERMKNGEFEDGSMILRAKIDMNSPNMHMRDPIMYRIKHHHHHRTGDSWNIYPTYDWAHGQSDSIEKVTHSLCTLEFEVHRPLYEWFIQQLGIFPSRQIEFSRLNLNYTVLSKRKLKELVMKNYVDGWDDPRMMTIRGLRRRGYPTEALRNLVDEVGVTKQKSISDMSLLEFKVREVLNKTAPRVMAVLDPVKVVITNWEAGHVEQMEVENNPEDPDGGSRTMPFTRELYIERDDFMEDAPKKYFRLTVGQEVRFKGAFIVMCNEVVKDAEGNILELHCTYDPASRSGADTSGKKVKGTIHWVSAEHALDVEVRMYDRLFTVEDPSKDENKEGEEYKSYLEYLNPDSLQVLHHVKAEPSLKDAAPESSFQFMRKGYFVVDRDSTPERLVFNRTVTLRDNWAKQNK